MLNKDEAFRIAEQWTKDPFDEKTKKEIKDLLSVNDEKAIMDRFGLEMEFGTAGLRGIMGSGTYMMNQYTIARAARGMAEALSSLYPDVMEKGIVIGYDCRNNSEFFAKVAAETIVSSGIKVYLYQRLTPTPLVPFAIRRLKLKAGIMITSSHNPKEYNGFKVYWENGAQIISPIDKQISEYIKKIQNYSSIPRIPIEEAINKGLIIPLTEKDIDAYIDWVASTGSKRDFRNIKIVYTPLHGTGAYFTERVFKKLGFNDFNIVELQKEPDGNFPTISAPNPEIIEAMSMALEQAKKIDAELILANDGDADRIGVAIKHNNNYITLTGNQIGTILVYYVLKMMKQEGKLTGKEFVVSTVVSTPLTEKICNFFGTDFIQTLTGFKWMGNIAEKRVNQGDKFILAFEEAFGVTIGDSRDKDGITAITLMAEVAAYCKSKGKTLIDLFTEMYSELDYHKEIGVSKFYEGAEGLNKMNTIMNNIRANKPTKFGNFKVKKIADYLEKKIFVEGKEIDKTSLPIQNLLYFTLEDNSWIAIRPSGTEPKIKLYIGVIEKTNIDSIDNVKQLSEKKIESLKKMALKLLS